jgi:hypothetical protein
MGSAATGAATVCSGAVAPGGLRGARRGRPVVRAASPTPAARLPPRGVAEAGPGAGREAPTEAAVLGVVATGAGLALGVRTVPVPAADDEPGVDDGAGEGSGAALGVAVAATTGGGPCAAATPPRIPA